jgi:Flp pilus assembly protein TadD
MDLAHSIKPDFVDLRTRAELLELCGDTEGADRLRELSMEIAREVDLTCYAYQLLWRDRVDDAIDLLERNALAHPDSWNVRHSLGEAYELLGDHYSAAMNFRMALALTEDEENLEAIATGLERVTRLGSLEAAAS